MSYFFREPLKSTPVEYVIEENKTQFVLYSIVPTNFGGDAKNFIREGTYDECAETKEMLKSMNPEIIQDGTDV